MRLSRPPAAKPGPVIDIITARSGVRDRQFEPHGLAAPARRVAPGRGQRLDEVAYALDVSPAGCSAAVTDAIAAGLPLPSGCLCGERVTPTVSRRAAAARPLRCACGRRGRGDELQQS
jgi:hypothetical protein